MAISANLGFPRIGPKRELKKAVESYWKGDISEKQLLDEAKKIRKKNWELQKDIGIDHIPSNDFSFYDHVLDTIALVGAIPERYDFKGGDVSLDTYFAMARGQQGKGRDVTAMEMTKWFDTNYHYMVPELTKDQEFEISSSKIFDEFSEAKKLGVKTRPVLLGPVSFLLLAKTKGKEFNTLDLLPKLSPVYSEILAKLEKTGAEWIQIDEPCLVLDSDDKVRAAYKKAYETIAKNSDLKLVLTTYFDILEDNIETAFSLPVTAVHVDLVRALQQLDKAISLAKKEDKFLSIGIVDGRNIWRNNLNDSLKITEKAVKELGDDKVIVAPSCSLLHSPVDLDNEIKLDNELKSWLAFAKQKLQEIKLLTDAANGDKNKAAFIANEKAVQSRKTSKRIHNQNVKKRISAITGDMKTRHNPFKTRNKLQHDALDLPLLPTTTIGSFPQTAEVRAARANFKSGELSKKDYEKFLEKEIKNSVDIQEELGIDVLVHGEFERNDMVEYFGEQLEGFAFSENGWVQSYGSRCVKPPIIFGDVWRSEPMTVRWAKYAQNLTKKYMKGMLTGPVTILQWSFVRNDQPRSETCRQIALAMRDEVLDLEKAGIRIIQIDEAALREGLPLRKSDWKNYLNWAVECFRLTASGVKDETQIHTHMCYSEFNDIIEAVANMDADVISIETSRSQMELLDAFVNFKYPNEIGPGVYDIHSPRIPSEKEMEDLLHKALKVLSPRQIWVNPDCGLKTRGWKEVKPSLERMVVAAKKIRGEISKNGLKKAANT